MNNFVPLSTMAVTVDALWAIEPNIGMRYKRMLDRIDLTVHLQQVQAEQPTLEKAAARTRRRPLRADMADVDDDDPDGIDDEPFDPDIPAEDDYRERYSVRDGVATIEMYGPMTKRPQSWGSGCSTVLVRRAIRQAVADPAVGAILFCVDSPGGQVSGTSDLADDIRRASLRMPVKSFAEDSCCSAAYWSACVAGDGFYCNQIATIGSIGCLMILEDTSEAAKEAGVTVHVIGSGDLKGIGSDGAPVMPEHLAYLQSYVDRSAQEFHAAVQTARKLAPDQMAEIKRAGMYIGSDAVAMGLVDGIKSRDEVHAMLAAKVKPADRTSRPAMPTYGSRLGNQRIASPSQPQAFADWWRGGIK